MNEYHNRYRREISGLLRGVLEIFALPIRHTASVGRWMPTSNLSIVTYLSTYLTQPFGPGNGHLNSSTSFM